MFIINTERRLNNSSTHEHLNYFRASSIHFNLLSPLVSILMLVDTHVCDIKIFYPYSFSYFMLFLLYSSILPLINSQILVQLKLPKMFMNSIPLKANIKSNWIFFSVRHFQLPSEKGKHRRNFWSVLWNISLLKTKPYHISHYKNILLCQETTREASGGKKLGLQKKKKLLDLPIKINMELLL